MRMLKCLLALLTVCDVRAQPAHPEIWYGRPDRPAIVSPDVFPIIGWGGAPTDARLLDTMREAGFNIAGFAPLADVPHVKAAGLRCFVTDRRAEGYDWNHLPPDEVIRKNLTSLAQEGGSDPAVLGFLLCDEPNASQIPGIAHVKQILHEVMPGKIGYVSVLPYIVKPEEHGAPSYEAYVRMVVDVLHEPFLSYDNYSLVEGRMRPQFYNNLEIIRRISLDTGTPFWNCVLANAHFNYMDPTDATLHLQVYSTLAYGGRGIQLFTYLAYPDANFRLAPIDQFGNKTPTWGMTQRINYELNVLAPTLAKLRSTGVYHAPDAPEYGQPLSKSGLVKAVHTEQQEIVEHPATAHFLVGEFRDEQNRPYLMAVNKSLTESFRFDVALAGGGELRCISPYSGKEQVRGVDWLAPGAGRLCRVDSRPVP